MKFAKNPLPIVYDHESATESSHLLGESEKDSSSSAHPYPARSGLEPLHSVSMQQPTKDEDSTTHDSIAVNSTEESSSIAVESSETAVLLRSSSMTTGGKKRQQHHSGESEKSVQIPMVAIKVEGEGRGLGSADEDNEDEDEEEEEFEVHSDSRCTSSYVTENTEDSLTGALDNRVGTAVFIKAQLIICNFLKYLIISSKIHSDTKKISSVLHHANL